MGRIAVINSIASNILAENRKFAFRIHQPRHGSVVAMRVYVNGKLIRRIRGHRIVRVVVRNLGASPHQVTVVRTATFGARLRLEGARAVVHPIAASIVVRPGKTATLVVSLARGSYMLLDNLPWSYWKGTSVAFSVR